MTSTQTYEDIRKLGPASTIFISHGASGDWFIVEPQVGGDESGMLVSDNVRRLLKAGRTVYMIPVVDIRRGSDGVIRLWSSPDVRAPRRRWRDRFKTWVNAGAS